MNDVLVNDVLAADDERRRTLVEKDYDALEKTLDDDLKYIHSSGRSDTKASYLASLRTGTLAYEDVELTAREVRTYGDIATLTGNADMTLVTGGGSRPLRIVYATVWKRSGDSWSLVQWSSTPRPSETKA